MAEVTHSLQLLTLENLQVSLRTLARVIMGDNNAFDFLLVSQGGVLQSQRRRIVPGLTVQSGDSKQNRRTN